MDIHSARSPAAAQGDLVWVLTKYGWKAAVVDSVGRKLVHATIVRQQTSRTYEAAAPSGQVNCQFVGRDPGVVRGPGAQVNCQLSGAPAPKKRRYLLEFRDRDLFSRERSPKKAKKVPQLCSTKDTKDPPFDPFFGFFRRKKFRHPRTPMMSQGQPRLPFYPRKLLSSGNPLSTESSPPIHQTFAFPFRCLFVYLLCVCTGTLAEERSNPPPNCQSDFVRPAKEAN